MDGSDLKATALPDDRIGSRCGDGSVQIWRFEDVETRHHLA
jgi:hypothetical protein